MQQIKKAEICTHLYLNHTFALNLALFQFNKQSI